MPVSRSAKKIPVQSTPVVESNNTKPLSVDDLVGGTPPPAPVIPVTQPPLAAKPVTAPVRMVTPVNNNAPTATYQSRRTFVQPYNRRPRMVGQDQSFSDQQPKPYFYHRPPRQDFFQPREMQDANVPTETVTGFLELMTEGHGFLRPKFIPSERDVYISQSQIRKFNLRPGDEVTGQARQPKDNERYFGLLKVEKVNDQEAEAVATRPQFDDLVPIYPKDQIRLESGKAPISTRIIDLFAPIGFGQRGLIVSPPKAGKTTILKEIAYGITHNYPNVHLMAALIGERPEEVTDISRSIKGEVIASHFDESPAEQTKVAEMSLNRAKRLVELGKDVVILLDSITRLARAYNLTVNSSGRTLSGGFDPAALYPAKRFLGAARKNENGGSLTIIGTALVDTGSRMDDLIYEEFKGTGNMELHLNRQLAEKRIFPAIDIDKSGTRQEQLLFDEERMKKIITLRAALSLRDDSAEKTTALSERLAKTESNEEFLSTLAQAR